MAKVAQGLMLKWEETLRRGEEIDIGRFCLFPVSECTYSPKGIFAGFQAGPSFTLTFRGSLPLQMYAWERKPRMRYALRHSSSVRSVAVERTDRLSRIAPRVSVWIRCGRSLTMLSHGLNNGLESLSKGLVSGRKPHMADTPYCSRSRSASGAMALLQAQVVSRSSTP